jgi:hypothetical protein
MIARFQNSRGALSITRRNLFRSRYVTTVVTCGARIGRGAAVNLDICCR